MRWLLVGALGPETLPVARRLERPRRVARRLVVGRLGQHEVGVLRAGVGPTRAFARSREGLAAWPANAVLSFGTCGALVDRWRKGDLVSARHLFREEEPAGVLAPLPHLAAAALTTVREAVWTTSRRDALACAGAEVVDMEAAAVREAAVDLPFVVVKVVSDRAGGDPRDPIGPARQPSPWRIARFTARALLLCETRLAPALVDWLARDGSPPAGS